MTPNNANTYLPGTIQIPSALNITAISNSYPMVVTAEVNPITESNNYVVGQVVRLTVPRTYGMFQAHNLQGQIIAIDGLDFSLNLDSRQFDVFSVPTGNVEQPASLSPAGSRNLQFNNNTGQVPFQSLNDRGN
jgi:hypothetical protein